MHLLPPHAQIEQLDDTILPVTELVRRCPAKQLMALYKTPAFKTAEEFLVHLATTRGKLKKGGTVDMEVWPRCAPRGRAGSRCASWVAVSDCTTDRAQPRPRSKAWCGAPCRAYTPIGPNMPPHLSPPQAAARILLQDWNDGRIPYHTLPPKRVSSNVAGSAAIVQEWGPVFEADSVQEEALMAALPTAAQGGFVMDTLGEPGFDPEAPELQEGDDVAMEGRWVGQGAEQTSGAGVPGSDVGDIEAVRGGERNGVRRH